MPATGEQGYDRGAVVGSLAGGGTLGLLTLPVGMNLCVQTGITGGEVGLAAAVPCRALLLLGVVLLSLFPGLATWLPGVVFG